MVVETDHTIMFMQSNIEVDIVQIVNITYSIEHTATILQPTKHIY